MNKPAGNRGNFIARSVRRLWVLIFRSPILAGVLGMFCLVVLFYAEENWRGMRAWEQCKRELSARGARMEPSSQSTVPIPDNLNVLKAPGMSHWFREQVPNELASRLGRVWNSTPQRGSKDLIEITVVSQTNQSALFASDLCLDYDAPVLSLASPAPTQSIAADTQVIPLIVMDSVPLSDAIKNFARQAGRSYLLDSNLIWSFTRTGPTFGHQPFRWFLERFAHNASFQEPCVNHRWENVTAFQGLMALLENYNLVWSEDLSNHVGRISIKTDSSSMVQLNPAAHEHIRQALARVVTSTDPETHTLSASQGFVLFHSDNQSAGAQQHLVRITVRSAVIPTVREVESFFPRDTLPVRASFALRALPSGTNTFRVFADPQYFCSAEDYLALTDPLKPEFDALHDALKRPYARFYAEQERQVSSPPRNFVTSRVVSQALAQRAQSYLLLGEPGHALDEVTLLHDLRGVVEAEPFSLVGAMVEGAITGIYISVIHDGLRLGAWREPQLVALQGQLEKIHLGSLLIAGLSSERQEICRTIETANAGEFTDALDPGHPNRSFFDQIKSPGFCFLTFGPRGWRYQSMATTAYLLQGNIACFDLVTQTLRCSDINQADTAVEAARKSASPTIRFAGVATPAFGRAWLAMAHNQSLVDQAYIACALERYRLHNGEYPADLPSLSPGFANQVPRHIIYGAHFHYRRLDRTHFTLYSVGWNGKDESGSANNTNSPTDYTKGNWAWN